MVLAVRSGLLDGKELAESLYRPVPAGYVACVGPELLKRRRVRARWRTRTRPMAVVYITHKARAGWVTISPVLSFGLRSGDGWWRRAGRAGWQSCRRDSRRLGQAAARGRRDVRRRREAVRPDQHRPRLRPGPGL